MKTKPKPLPSRAALLCTVAAFVLLGAAWSKREQTASGPIALSAPAKQVIEGFEAELAQAVEEDGIGGTTMAVVVGDQVSQAKAFGWADKEQRIPASPETVYRIGSISKSITVVAMMRLVEQGALNLEDPVERYFPEVKHLEGHEDHPPITLRQLASHTSGLPHEPNLESAWVGPIGRWEQKILTSIPKTSFSAAPGEKYQYSNIGIGILGLTISRAAGKPFMDLVHDLLFEPLGMRHSAYILTPEMKKLLAKGYANNQPGGGIDTERPQREHGGRGYKVPNGGVYSTVGDLARFIGAMTGASPAPILSAETRREMLRIQTPEGDETGYGLGFVIDIVEEVRIAGHHGGMAGYSAYHAFDPVSKIGVILCRNYNRGKINLREAGKRLLGEIIRAQEGTTAVDKAG